MASQTLKDEVGHNGASTRPAAAMRRNAAGLAHDIVCLAELQARLFQLDAKQIAKRLMIASVVALGSACVLLGCVPVLLIGVAELLSEAMGFSSAAGLCLTGGAVGLMSIAVLIAAVFRLRGGFSVMERSGHEMRENIDWLKAVLKRTT